MKKTFVIDVDNTVCITPFDTEKNIYDYKNSEPYLPIVNKIKKLYNEGHYIILFSSRGMRTYNGDINQIYKNIYPVMLNFLNYYNIPYNELILGKPWGPNVYYIDDKNLTIQQFVMNNEDEYNIDINKNSTLG